jgi:hypothetical protein
MIESEKDLAYLAQQIDNKGKVCWARNGSRAMSLEVVWILDFVKHLEPSFTNRVADLLLAP